MRYFLLFLIIWTTSAYSNETHCSSQEKVIFSCAISKSKKIISVCATSKLNESEGALAYRFGVLGKPELEFPEQADTSRKKFRLAHYSRHQTDRVELTFDSGKFNYAVFDYYEGDQNPQYVRGVRVSSGEGRGKEIQLQCSGKAISSLSKLEGIVPCDDGNALAFCQ